MILDDTIKAILAHSADGALAFVTQGEDGPHLAATWNSYVTLKGEEMFLPAGGMKKTEHNLSKNEHMSLIVAGRHVKGFHGDGAGYRIEGRALFLGHGPDVEAIKAKFPWARGAIRITPTRATQIN